MASIVQRSTELESRRKALELELDSVNSRLKAIQQALECVGSASSRTAAGRASGATSAVSARSEISVKRAGRKKCPQAAAVVLLGRSDRTDEEDRPRADDGLGHRQGAGARKGVRQGACAGAAQALSGERPTWPRVQCRQGRQRDSDEGRPRAHSLEHCAQRCGRGAA